jgi:hypothetical protein
MKIATLLLFLLGVSHLPAEETLTRTFYYDVPQRMLVKSDLVNLFYKEPDGSVTYISIPSSKLAAYLQKIDKPTVSVAIRHDAKSRSIELLTIDGRDWNSFENKGTFWAGKIPKITQ